jgi:hypothetical protein
VEGESEGEVGLAAGGWAADDGRCAVLGGHADSSGACGMVGVMCP